MSKIYLEIIVPYLDYVDIKVYLIFMRRFVGLLVKPSISSSAMLRTFASKVF